MATVLKLLGLQFDPKSYVGKTVKEAEEHALKNNRKIRIVKINDVKLIRLTEEICSNRDNIHVKTTFPVRYLDYDLLPKNWHERMDNAIVLDVISTG